jgi:vancomycin resistance protein YoaR
MRWWPRRKVYIDNLPKTHDFRFGVIFVIGLALVFGALYGVGYVVAGNKLPAGTTVAEVDVGGMSPDRARSVLQEKLAPRLERPLQVTAAGKTFTVDPQLTGFTFDIDATLADALGGSPWDPRHMLHVILGGDDLDPVVDLDNDELVASLKRVADHVERRPVDSAVSFSAGRVEVSYGRAGRALDYQRSGDRLEDALVQGDSDVTLVVVAVQPHVTAIKATRFVDKVGRKAVESSVRIKVADSVMTLTPRQFGPALLALPSKNGLRLDVDQARLAKRARPALKKLPYHPVDAHLRFVGDRPTIVHGTSGVTVAPPDLAKAVLKAVGHSGKKRVARATVTPDNPRVSTQDLRMMQVKERISSSVASYTVGSGRSDPVTVLHRLDGALIAPDDTLSFLRRVGDGSSPAASFVASMAYEAGFFAGLDVPEHTQAHFYSDTFAPGLDAGVESPSTDLVFHNSSPYGVYVRAYVDPPARASSRHRTAHVEMWSTRYWRVRAFTSDRYDVVRPQVIVDKRKSCVPRDGIAGFDVDVTRVLTREGHKRSERTHTGYAPLDQVRCG